MEYKEKNGTFYDINTSDKMVDILESLRVNNTRCRFHWGNAETGNDWGDTYEVKGTIGRSIGSKKIPILLFNSRSVGGGAILTHCIVKITATRGNKTIYLHPKYNLTKP